MRDPRTRRMSWVALLAVVFVGTRASLFLSVTKPEIFSLPSISYDVDTVYQHWYSILRSGTFPQGDVMWQYPPAAAAVLLAPGLLPLDYPTAFYTLSLVADVATMGVLLTLGRPTRPGTNATPTLRSATRQWRLAPAWVWTLGVLLQGPIGYARYDLMVTAVAVTGLTLVARRHRDRRQGAGQRLGGILLGIGAMIKLWPALLLLGVRRGQATRRSWTAAVLTGLALMVFFVTTMPGALSFLHAQQGRGIEVESPAATPFHLLRHLGWHGTTGLHFGSVEYLGPGVRAVGLGCVALSALALCWLVYWRLTSRHRSAANTVDAALVAVLLFVVTSRVVSPQYMVWLVGVAAVCAASRSSVMRAPTVLVLCATGLSTVEYPYWFGELVSGQPSGILLVTVRNLLLVSAALLGCYRLWQSGRATDDTDDDAGKDADEEAADAADAAGETDSAEARRDTTPTGPTRPDAANPGAAAPDVAVTDPAVRRPSSAP